MQMQQMQMKIQIYKYTNTNIQIYKYKYTNIQIQIYKYTNTQIQTLYLREEPPFLAHVRQPIECGERAL